MKLASLLEHHRKTSIETGALKDALGDGFLLRSNRIYRSIRAAALRAGFRFSSAPNEAYRALPLSQLDAILASKVIPYADNVSVLDRLEEKIPRATDWNDISDNLKGNHVFHESCHAVARSLVSELGPSLAANCTADRAPVLALLLEESFANASELLSIVDAEDQVHRIFLELNSYVYMLNDRVHLKNATGTLGEEGVLVFILLSYLHANFLREMNDDAFTRSLKLALPERDVPNDPKVKKSLKQLSRIAFELNPRFREVTTRFYLRLSGVPIDVVTLKDFDFLGVIERTPAAREFLKRAGKL